MRTVIICRLNLFVCVFVCVDTKLETAIVSQCKPSMYNLCVCVSVCVLLHRPHATWCMLCVYVCVCVMCVNNSMWKRMSFAVCVSSKKWLYFIQSFTLHCSTHTHTNNSTHTQRMNRSTSCYITVNDGSLFESSSSFFSNSFNVERKRCFWCSCSFSSHTRARKHQRYVTRRLVHHTTYFILTLHTHQFHYKIVTQHRADLSYKFSWTKHKHYKNKQKVLKICIGVHHFAKSAQSFLIFTVPFRLCFTAAFLVISSLYKKYPSSCPI